VGRKDLLAQPLGPEELLLLLARWAEAAAAAGEGDHSCGRSRTRAARSRTPVERSAGTPATPARPPPAAPVAGREALGPDPQQLLEVALHEPVERRLTRTPRLVDPATDLHAQTQAEGRGSGGKGGGLWRSGLPTTGGVWPRHWPRKVRGAGKTQSRDVRLARVSLEAGKLRILSGAVSSYGSSRLSLVPFSVQTGPTQPEATLSQVGLRSGQSGSGSAGVGG
jgi:hypothetical protein